MLYFVLVCARITYYIWYTMYIICIRRISSVCVMLKIKHSSQTPTHINTKLLEGENDSVKFSSLVWDDPTLLLIMTLASCAIQYKPKKGVWDSSPCVCGGSPVSKLLLTLCAATACPLTKTRLGWNIQIQKLLEMLPTYLKWPFCPGRNIWSANNKKVINKKNKKICLGRKDMMMTPLDFYSSITPDCSFAFGVS